jgi:hypothetical protein
MELQHIIEIGIFIIVFGYLAYQDSKKTKENNKKLLRIKEAQLSLSVCKSIWFMSIWEYMNKGKLTDELSDAQKLLQKAIKEERYEDAETIKDDIEKHLNNLKKTRK